MSERNVDKAAMGKRLRALRERRGVSMEDVARETGLRGQQAVWRYESGRYTPKAEHLAALAAYYSVSPSWVLYGEDEAGMADQDIAVELGRQLAQESVDDFRDSNDPIVRLLEERHWERLRTLACEIKPSVETIRSLALDALREDDSTART